MLGQHVMIAGKQIKFTLLTTLCPIVSGKMNILRAFLVNLLVLELENNFTRFFEHLIAWYRQLSPISVN